MQKQMNTDPGPPAVRAVPDPTKKPVPIEPPMAIMFKWRGFMDRSSCSVPVPQSPNHKILLAGALNTMPIKGLTSPETAQVEAIASEKIGFPIVFRHVAHVSWMGCTSLAGLGIRADLALRNGTFLFNTHRDDANVLTPVTGTQNGSGQPVFENSACQNKSECAKQRKTDEKAWSGHISFHCVHSQL
jgi:hypothetical protein